MGYQKYWEPRGGVAQGCTGNTGMLAALLPSLGGGEREGGGCGPPRTTQRPVSGKTSGSSWPGSGRKWPISPLEGLLGAPGQDLAGNGQFHLSKLSLGGLPGAPGQEMATCTSKSDLWEASRGHLAGSGRKWPISPLKLVSGKPPGGPGQDLAGNGQFYL